MRANIIDGRYVLAESLGSGGMAEVYLAHDEVLDRDVALKVLRSQYVSDEEFSERFRREARSAANLSHPNIVQVYDRGETEDGTCYIAMEYVPGGTLKKRIEEKGPFDPRKAVAVAAQIAGALEAAHERGVIHRDIKPQNVLVTSSGDLKVTDFGIARAASAVTISVTNAVFGTAGYISPEQALGEPVSPASDLYSLGVILYEMLTGELPYTADNPMAVCMKHVTEPLRPPRMLNPAIPDEIDALVVKLLAKVPVDRYGSAPEFLADLERVRNGLSQAPGISAETRAQRREAEQAPPRRAVRPRRRRVSRAMTVAAVAVLALLGTVLLGLSQQGAGGGSLPRVQDAARGLIDPPSETTTGTAETGATPDASASPAASASPTAVLPATPPPNDDTQPPGQSQYTGGN